MRLWKRQEEREPPTYQHDDWRDYPGETVSEKANNAYKDERGIEIKDVVTELERDLRHRIQDLEDRL